MQKARTLSKSVVEANACKCQYPALTPDVFSLLRKRVYLCLEMAPGGELYGLLQSRGTFSEAGHEGQKLHHLLVGLIDKQFRSRFHGIFRA